MAIRRLVRWIGGRRRSPVVERTERHALWCAFADLDRVAGLHRVHVPQTGAGVVRTVIPAFCAEQPRADKGLLAELRRFGIDQRTRLWVDPVDPIDVLSELPDVLDRAARRIVNEDKSAFIIVHDLPLAGALDEQEFTRRRVEVPDIVRHFLMVPF